MTAIDRYQPDTTSADTWLDYTASEYCDISDDFFTFEMHQNHPRIPFYDTLQCSIFRGINRRKLQIKRRILDHQAKY